LVASSATPNDTTEVTYDDQTLELPEVAEAPSQTASQLGDPPSPVTVSPVSGQSESSTEEEGDQRMTAVPPPDQGAAPGPEGPAGPEAFFGQLEDAMRRMAAPRAKVRQPDVYAGDRTRLRAWLAEIALYFQSVGWGQGHDDERITYTCSLLRGDASRWLTPFTEGVSPKTWNTYEEFLRAIRVQFGEVDPRGAARLKLQKLRQGDKNMTEYWNEFRLLLTEAQLDDITAGELLYTGMSSALQEEFEHCNEEIAGTQTLASWAIEKETRLLRLKHLRKGKNKETVPPRNNNGTFQKTAPALTGDPMDLDATRRKNRLPISTQEFQRRMRNKLCLRCARPGHMARDCRSQAREEKAPNPQPKNSQNWRTNMRAREITVEEETNADETSQSGNDGSPQ
jgi:hypothetical protein